ncbi:MAG: hypothetical protein JO170_15955 [Verrucomicrobia bacterium]|nr:hypothetical protein [Verrucomicrobiota bacterium]
MSLPTLRNDLSKIYEPKAPAPTQRLATLVAAKRAGLHVFVAMAPTYPESESTDLKATLRAIAELDPITVFHEPINLRADNAVRIAQAASSVGIPMRTQVFHTREAWRAYALEALQSVWSISRELRIRERVHLWPEKTLGAKQVVLSMSNPECYVTWLKARWNRVSEWPNANGSKRQKVNTAAS